MISHLKKRFDELSGQIEDVARTTQTRRDQYNGISYEHVDDDQLLGWCVKVRNLLSIACGKDSEHFRSFVEGEKAQSFEGNSSRLTRLRSVFLAAKEDFEGGYLASIKNLVEAEVFSSELDQAQELLTSGYRVAAAVICGVVLETNLRNLCKAHGIPAGSLDRMNADLVKAGQYNTLVQKRITALAAIRNSAAHGNTDDFDHADVKSMIIDVERHVINWLS